MSIHTKKPILGNTVLASCGIFKTDLTLLKGQESLILSTWRRELNVNYHVWYLRGWYDPCAINREIPKKKEIEKDWLDNVINMLPQSS